MDSEDLECEDGEYDLACENARLIVENERLRRENYAMKDLLRRNTQGIEATMLELNILKLYASPEVSLKIQEARAALQPQPEGKPDAA